MINELIQHDKIDLIRETIIIVVGLIIRWLEKKKIKNDTV